MYSDECELVLYFWIIYRRADLRNQRGEGRHPFPTLHVSMEALE